MRREKSFVLTNTLFICNVRGFQTFSSFQSLTHIQHLHASLNGQEQQGDKNLCLKDSILHLDITQV